MNGLGAEFGWVATKPNAKNETAGTASTVRPHISNALGQAQLNGNPAPMPMPPNIDLVLSRLDGVRRAGKGFIARCPAHIDRNASLAVSCGDDGRLLMHCFAGCSIHDVVAALGLLIQELFPRTLPERVHFDDDPHGHKAREHFRGMRKLSFDLALVSRVRAAAGVLDDEAGVVLIAACDIEHGRALTKLDLDRMALAGERIRSVRLAIGGQR
jgi:hypothetical protein